MAMIDWAVYAPIILKLVGSTVLSSVSYVLKNTKQPEKEKLLEVLREISDEVLEISQKTKEENKAETGERIRGLMQKLDSQKYRQTLRPNVANVITRSLQYGAKEKKSETTKILNELRKLLNTWIHDVEFSGKLPTAKR
jgi:ketopantoate reductase